MSRKELQDLHNKKPNSSSKKQKSNAIVDSIIKNIRNIFRLKKGYKAIKDIIISDIRTLFKSEKEDYYKPKNCRCF